ncbi:hypothetical protein ATE48_08065 [Candidatus Viadribacter manganicus]|uniref:ASPIC/UnbV domain-containing protein n=1 Tax=Candidatus Viadribacter manganicus TaxID=1759059 RepID=A0A1B1AH37_9PROT|nr:hypothetical protein ATE48_08065 [Candidatus Viadribacter manganicus]
MTILGFAAILAGCASAGELSQSCPAPRLEATPLIIGDGSRDRGFPGGISLADIDDDGDLDLMATGGYSPAQGRPSYRANTLYINDGSGNFSHSPDPEFLVADNPNSGSTWADIDDDGDLDAFIAVQHGRPDVFLRNLGGGHFAREQLGDATATRGSNFAESWADMDGDGDMDLMSGAPTMETPAGPLHVFRNDRGQFIRVTGVAIENGPTSNAATILWADFDNDGDQDLFATNSDILRSNGIEPASVETPRYYRNDGGWVFTQTEGQGFDSREFASTAAARGDVDNDGDLDLFIGHVGYGSANGRDRIFLNDGRGRFTLDGRFEGHVHPDKEASTASFVDFDLDGDLDLATTAYNEGIRLFSNDGSGAFDLVHNETLLNRVTHYWGAASGDIDGDGDPDLVLGSWGETAAGDYVTILRNDSDLCGRSLRMELRSRHGAVDPLGARVTLVTRSARGERIQLREASGQSTFRSQSGSNFLYGVPEGERVLRAEIRWPNGRIQIVRQFRMDQTNTFEEPR